MSDEQFHQQTIMFHKMHSELRTEVTQKLDRLDSLLTGIMQGQQHFAIFRKQIKGLYKFKETTELTLAEIEGVISAFQGIKDNH